MYKHLALTAAVCAVFSLQASAAGTQLTVYTALEAEQLKSYKQAFEKANPDIEIKWVRDSTGIITAKLLAEKKPPASRRGVGPGGVQPGHSRPERHA